MTEEAAGVLFAIAAVTALLVTVRNVAKKRKQEAGDEAAGESFLQCAKDWQQECQDSMASLSEQSVHLFESMPEHLRTAEAHLDQAEVDFADGAFAPFWDSVEMAVQALGRFDESVALIKQHALSHADLVTDHKRNDYNIVNKNKLTHPGLVEKWQRDIYNGDPPAFPLASQSVAALAVGTDTSRRMNAIVRKAQRDFQFATIYEQRKTNQNASPDTD